MDFEKAFQKIVNGIFVVTTTHEGRKNGLTAAWVTRVSHVPPLIAVSVGNTRFSHDLIKYSRNFCVNILSDKQEGLSNHFGFQSGRDKEKFDDVPHHIGDSGAPILEDVAGFLDCKVVSEIEAGDHTVFIGEVISAGTSEGKPLTFLG